MIDFLEQLKSYALPTPTARTPATQSNSPFTRLEAGGRIICEYGGLLAANGTPGRYLLRCEHLRSLPGEKFPPYRVEPDFTHQLWIFSRSPKNEAHLDIIFRAQFNLDLPGQDGDQVALEVTEFLAYLMQHASEPDAFVPGEAAEQFWIEAVETHLEMSASHSGI
ncbi:hypothetical protein L3556_06610 [Candidatus Synechococcus calcipolaris G9]|uniref:Uncharacterized protein n=1 Tax=Candidatus Synechococcus calcipolaris G9 TaxID=1497997 RepID=A0ABT6EYX1_9SYNE|nr:hypothetical protein [Candidatus Synechococcus calcipolaris]MDG2990606.1 hypothetical protein [Candidatus Synechococcus calcipolaris G9]